LLTANFNIGIQQLSRTAESGNAKRLTNSCSCLKQQNNNNNISKAPISAVREG